MKGSMLNRFEVGETVYFPYRGQRGVLTTAHGAITKLHRSTSTGVAEIRVDGGGRKVRRKLCHLTKARDFKP